MDQRANSQLPKAALSLLTPTSQQTSKREKRYSSDTGYCSSGRPSTETLSNRSGLFTRKPSTASNADAAGAASPKSSTQNLGEVLKTLLMPSDSFLKRTFARLLTKYNNDVYESVRNLIKDRIRVDISSRENELSDRYPDGNLFNGFDEHRILSMISCLSEVSNDDFFLIAENFGNEMANLLYFEGSRYLKAIGHTLEDFINSINGLLTSVNNFNQRHDLFCGRLLAPSSPSDLHLPVNNKHCSIMCFPAPISSKAETYVSLNNRFSNNLRKKEANLSFPTKSCANVVNEKQLIVHFNAATAIMGLFVPGLLKKLSKFLFEIDIDICCESVTASYILSMAQSHIDLMRDATPENKLVFGRLTGYSNSSVVSSRDIRSTRTSPDYKFPPNTAPRLSLPLLSCPDEQKVVLPTLRQKEARKVSGRLRSCSGVLPRTDASPINQDNRNETQNFLMETPKLSLRENRKRRFAACAGGDGYCKDNLLVFYARLVTKNDIENDTDTKARICKHREIKQSVDKVIKENKTQKKDPYERFIAAGRRCNFKGLRRANSSKKCNGVEITTQGTEVALKQKISCGAWQLQSMETRTSTLSSKTYPPSGSEDNANHNLEDRPEQTDENMDEAKQRSMTYLSINGEKGGKDVNIKIKVANPHEAKTLSSVLPAREPTKTSHTKLKDEVNSIQTDTCLLTKGVNGLKFDEERCNYVNDNRNRFKDSCLATPPHSACPWSSKSKTFFEEFSNLSMNLTPPLRRRFHSLSNSQEELPRQINETVRRKMKREDGLSLTLKQTQSQQEQVDNNNQWHFSRVGIATFCKAFPFHFIMDREMCLLQVGIALLRVISADGQSEDVKTRKSARKNTPFSQHFKIVSPHCDSHSEVSFNWIQRMIREQFTLQISNSESQQMSSEWGDCGNTYLEGMELRGQMIHLHERDCILFMGSPNLSKLDELKGTGIFISDIPIHDATRDVILVGEQAKAQESLKRRMNKLKETLEENNNALEQERRLNVELLFSIFPADIAEDLWLGKQVQAKTLESVTMLFSDIVGFTSICSSCTPMQVITMLSKLYLLFDRQCGIYDVYKVETIGDAYCVAGGLHRTTKIHAHQIAWMALFMIKCANTVHTPKGSPIRMRIGVHSGSVVTGVVGTRMPRYCLFGSNVTLANQFESHSEAGRINISPTTHRLICGDPGYKLTPRPPEALPAGFPNDLPRISYFLDDYNPKIDNTNIFLDETLLVSTTTTEDGLMETAL
ncbi:uncharacterized protein LOC143469725 isoform X2 [Clavelina lepadiformis]|uniref:uncharacterized protein LOC143469725 isoform X2 n=1 Tax=Clavelina lepadiformis TaxID=159417 RepID=UPI0040425A7D